MSATDLIQCVAQREDALETPQWVSLTRPGRWREISEQYPAPSLNQGAAMLALQAVFDIAVQESIRAGSLPDAAPSLVAALSRRLAEQIEKSDASPGRS